MGLSNTFESLAKLTLFILLSAAPAGATGGTVDEYRALQRCLHCIDSGCRSDGSPFPNTHPSTLGTGASRNVETYFGPHKKAAIAYPSITTRNELTGQDVFTFDVDEDVLILGASPAPRVKGVPGFWAYAQGVPYFCATTQITSTWNAPDLGSPFRILLPPMTKERGVRLRRYPRDSSLAEAWGMDDSELRKETPSQKGTRTLKCEPVLNANEKVSANNPYFALTDAIRFGVLTQALRTCQRSFLNERSIFLDRVRSGCIQTKIPFLISLLPKFNEARAYMDDKTWSKSCCARKFDDTFIGRFGRGGLKEDYTSPPCSKFDATPEALIEPRPPVGNKVPAR